MKNIKRIFFLDLSISDIIVESVGLGALSAWLEQNGYETKLMAFHEKNLNYKEIEDFKPDIIGIPLNYETIKLANQVCNTIRIFLPDVIFFSGGYLSTNNPEDVMRDVPELEFLIRGEGELTLLDVIQAISSGKKYGDVEGITYRENGKIVHNRDRVLIENLDILPFPDRSVMRQYAIPMAQVEGARGCPCRCTFCSYQLFWTCNHNQEKGKWRAKSPKVVVDEIEQLAREDGITRFRFLDGSFENPYMNTKRMNEIADEIIKRNLNITYFVNFRANIHRVLDDKLMSKLIKSGLISVFLGIESFDANDLKVFNKASTAEDAYKAIEFFQKYPIYLNIGMLNFYPYATTNSLRKNAEMLQKYHFSGRFLFLRNLVLYEGTPIYDMAKRDNLIKGDCYQVENYRFIDSRVESIYRYFQDLRKCYSNWIKLETYSTSYLHLHSHLQRYLRKEGDKEALEQVELFGKKVTDELTMIGEKFTCFVLKLIYLAEKGIMNP